ncbi:MAG: CoA transferase, partial [Myxococcota bacterium]|nr:CoA transferase [Myxococcota bacterium]
VLAGPATLDYTVNGRPYRRPGNPPGNRSAHPRVAPHNTYRCAGDDRWCAISVFTEDEWTRFRDAIDDPDWARDPRFADNAGRIANEDELDRLIEGWTTERTPEDVMHRLQRAGVTAGAVQTNADKAERDPQLRARNFFPEAPHREADETHRFEGFPVQFSRTEASVRQAAPPLGADGAYVLQTLLGLSDDEVAELAEEAAL